MEVIDAHQHFWIYDPVRDGWITEEMAVIRRDFLPDDLFQALQVNEVAGCVAVQADQSEAETAFLLDLAARHDFIHGVVGWVDLRRPDLPERLAHWSAYEKLKGVRHIVQAESDPNFLLRDDFCRGIRQLSEFKLTYDILVYPHQLLAVLEFVRRFPTQRFVIDHLAKPYIRDGYREGWALLMREIGRCPHVYCKLSGMVTEADWKRWRYEDLEPYLEVVLEAFGPQRVLFGSDWPVCTVAASYREVLGVIRRFAGRLTESEQAALFAGNARRCYHL